MFHYNLDRSWKNKKLKEIERRAIVGDKSTMVAVWVLLLTVWVLWELGSVSYMVLECTKFD